MKVRQLGFTLVELLIVVALISILAVAIVATINPVEQVNRARDARYKNDAAELLSAIERYYASTQSYPWMTVDSADYPSAATEYSALGEYGGVGVCEASTTEGGAADADSEGDCSSDGVLITSDELKSQFKNKEQFSSDVTDINRFYIFKPENETSVYVCFIPKAKINHTPSSNTRLWDLGMYGSDATNPLPSDISAVTASDASSAEWEDRTDSYFICVPE